jgi:hypothetical protein
LTKGAPPPKLHLVPRARRRFWRPPPPLLLLRVPRVVALGNEEGARARARARARAGGGAKAGRQKE